MFTCPRCTGGKVFKHFAHVQGGVCFLCQGTGKVAFDPNRSKPSNLKDESCDHIFHLVKYTNRECIHWVQFSVWDVDQTKAKYGSANICPNTIEYMPEHGEPIRNVPLSVAREHYRELLAQGYEPAVEADFMVYDALDRMFDIRAHKEAEAAYWAS